MTTMPTPRRTRTRTRTQTPAAAAAAAVVTAEAAVTAREGHEGLPVRRLQSTTTTPSAWDFCLAWVGVALATVTALLVVASSC